MKEKRLYDKDSIELYELIDNVKVKLLKNSNEYNELVNRILKIKNTYPNLRKLYENDNIIKLNEIECKKLQEIIELEMKIKQYEERQIFMLGARENYLYLRELELIK